MLESSISAQLKPYFGWNKGWSYRKWRDRKRPRPEVTSPEPAPFFPTIVQHVPLCMADIDTACDQRSRDPEWVPWKGARMRNRKLRNICPIGAFSPEITSSNVTRRDSHGSHVIGSALGVISRTSASYNRFLAHSLVICPFPAILFSWGAPSIITL